MKKVLRKQRIRKLKSAEDEKLFGKYNQIILILIGFFLTTVCGSIIGYILQDRAWDKQNRSNILMFERELAEKAFSDISSLIDERMYVMRRVYWAYKLEKEKSKKDERWEEYENILLKWNRNLNKNFSLLQIYFGKSFRKVFEEKIHWEFRKIGQLLEKIKYKSDVTTSELNEIANKFDRLNEVFYGFNIRILYSIRENEIGQFIE